MYEMCGLHSSVLKMIQTLFPFPPGPESLISMFLAVFQVQEKISFPRNFDANGKTDMC